MNETPKYMLIRRDKNGFVTEEQWEELGSNLPIMVGCIDSELELIDKDNWADWQSDLEKPDKYPYWRPVTRTDILGHNAISYVEELQDSNKFNLAYIDIADAYVAGAKWADEHPACQWISVEEKLPKYGELVVAYCTTFGTLGDGGSNMSTACLVRYHDGAFKDLVLTEMSATLKFTHWMPVPEIPRKDECPIHITTPEERDEYKDILKRKL